MRTAIMAGVIALAASTADAKVINEDDFVCIDGALFGQQPGCSLVYTDGTFAVRSEGFVRNEILALDYGVRGWWERTDETGSESPAVIRRLDGGGFRVGSVTVSGGPDGTFDSEFGTGQAGPGPNPSAGFEFTTMADYNEVRAAYGDWRVNPITRPILAVQGYRDGQITNDVRFSPLGDLTFDGSVFGVVDELRGDIFLGENFDGYAHFPHGQRLRAGDISCYYGCTFDLTLSGVEVFPVGPDGQLAPIPLPAGALGLVAALAMLGGLGMRARRA